MNGERGITVTDLDPDFVQRVHTELENRKICNYKLEITAGSSKGDNFLGVVAKIIANGTDENGKKITTNWIAKIPPQGEGIRKYVDVDALFAREMYVYEEIFPLFRKFQDERAVLSPFDYYADFVFSFHEQCTFVMEDMKSLGYVMRDKTKFLDYNHAKIVMRAYGKLHALSFALRDQHPELFEKLTENARNLFKYNRDESPSIKGGLHEKIIESLDPKEHSEAIGKYKNYASKQGLLLEDTIRNTNKYCVIGHGDSWVNNMLFKYEDSNHLDRPTKVCILDWQLCRYGSPAFDLSYFIFTCTDQALRGTRYDNLIKIYYHSLCQHLADLGSDPEVLFPYEALQSELKRASVLGLYMSTVVTRIMLSEVSEVPDLNNLSDADNFFKHKIANNGEYEDRLRGIVLDFVKYGYLDFEDA